MFVLKIHFNLTFTYNNKINGDDKAIMIFEYFLVGDHFSLI